METTKITYEAPEFYCTEFETEDILTVSSTQLGIGRGGSCFFLSFSGHLGIRQKKLADFLSFRELPVFKSGK